MLADGGPAQQRVTDRLQGLLVFHDSLALVGVPRGLAVHVTGQDRPPCLLQLQEHHVIGVAALEQGHVGDSPTLPTPTTLWAMSISV